MELFSITCDSCTARLKVRQQSVIGQILACPKCGSMVQVQPPEGWEPPPSASQQLNESDFKTFRGPEQQSSSVSSDAGLPKVDTKSLDANPTGHKKIVQRGGDQNPNRSGKSSRQTNQQQTNRTPAKQGQARPKADSPILPNAQWSPAASQQRQKIVLMICAAAVVLIVVLGFIGYLVVQSTRNAAKDKISNVESVDQLDPTSKKTNSTDKSDPSKSDAESKKQPANSGSNKTNSSVPDGPKKTNGKKDGNKDVRKKQDSENKKSNTPVMVGQDDDTNPGGDNSTNPQNPNQQRDPLTGLNFNTDDNAEPFDDFNDLTNSSPMTISNTVDSEDIESEIGIGTYIIGRPAPLKINPARLEDEIEINFKSKSLPQFLNRISDYSTLPIYLDIDEIQAAGIDFHKKSDYLNSGTVSQVLDQVLTPLELKTELRSWGVLVTTTNRDEILAREYEIFEFKEKPDQAYKAIAAVIESRFAPQSWVTQGGQAELIQVGRKFTIRQTRFVHSALKQFFDKANAANALTKIDGKTEIDPKHLSSFTTRNAAVLPTLQTPCDLDILVPEPLLHVIKKVESSTGLVILVDWPALLDKDWNPNVRVPWESRGEPVVRMLENIASSMNLAYRVIDEKTVELTTPGKISKSFSLEFYSCHKFMKNNKTNSLLDLVGTTMQNKVNTSAGMFLDFDPELQCLVAILPQPLHLRLERVMNLVDNPKPKTDAGPINKTPND